MTVISHDAFARQSLIRRTIRPDLSTVKNCEFCGNLNNAGKLFAYATKANDQLSGRVNPIKGYFCSVGCMRAYHG